MSETQAQVDALLAEAEALKNEAGGAGEAVQSDPTPSQPADQTKPQIDDRGLKQILQLQVPLQVSLADRRMPLREVLRISLGSIIEFEKPFDEELVLLVNNQPIAYGQAVKVGENFGLRITRIADVRERIDALGREE